jgi:type 1 glutamine amidotransferase
MIRFILTTTMAVLLAACSNGSSDNGSPANSEAATVIDGPFKMLVFSYTAGFRHQSIEPGKIMLQTLADANNFSVDYTEDPSQFTAENLTQYAAVFFLNTTLDIFNSEQEIAFEDFIHNGGGFVGVHSAADTEHDWPFYGELVGAYFLAHPIANQPGTLIVEDGDHPSANHVGESWVIQPTEEFYSFTDTPRDEVRVITRIDETSYRQTPNTSCDPSGPTFPNGYSGKQGDHPITWCHDKFAGRAWYTALGHEVTLYSDPDYQQHVLNGIFTVTHRVAASCAVLPKPADAPEYTPPEPYNCLNQLLP